MTLAVAVFNHLLGQNPALSAELARDAGRRVALSLPPLSVSGVITEAGFLAASRGEPEAILRLGAASLLTRLAGQPPSPSDVRIEGDPALATRFGQVLARMDWHVAEDVSRVLGDVAAHRLDRAVRGVAGFKGALAWRLLQNWAEHLREEAPMLARPADVAGFVDDVDGLRDDAARLEKRLARLEARAGQQGAGTGPA